MSKTFLERKNPDVPYVFISYSHADGDPDNPDKNFVGKLLTALNDYGADFWYDVKLRGGQNWYEKVREVTANKNCVGIIYIMSPDFIFSKACFQELMLLDELKKSHNNFHEYYILLDENEPTSFNEFMRSVRRQLLDRCFDDEDDKLDQTNKIKEQFNPNILYSARSKAGIADDKFVRKVFGDVFASWGCASEETGKLDTLVDDMLVGSDYKIKTESRMLTETVNRNEVEWKVFSFKGDTISAIFDADELYAATCRSLAHNAMADANRLINISDKAVDEKTQKEKHIWFDPAFLECLNKDENGNVLRYLRAVEHTKNYLQLKEALKRVPTTESADDGYFFVTDNQDNVLFADRASDDVYRHIHLDAYASVFPVIDIDLKKYKEYLKKR